ncbi:MAG: hypothetical protein E7554_06480 [Ruminococcaceae bacterium]|nr:hypothetical protein [Oscillospiraceae bacterium]
MNEHEVLVLNVASELEADAAIAALGDAGIAAYKKTVPNSGLLAMPGAFGLAENGIDIVTRKEDGPRAASILMGIGYEPLVEPADDDEDGEESGEKPMTVEEQKQALAKEYAELHPVKRVLLIVLILLMVCGTVWMVDFIINTIKGLI